MEWFSFMGLAGNQLTINPRNITFFTKETNVRFQDKMYNEVLLINLNSGIELYIKPRQEYYEILEKYIKIYS